MYKNDVNCLDKSVCKMSMSVAMMAMLRTGRERGVGGSSPRGARIDTWLPSDTPLYSTLCRCCAALEGGVVRAVHVPTQEEDPSAPARTQAAWETLRWGGTWEAPSENHRGPWWRLEEPRRGREAFRTYRVVPYRHLVQPAPGGTTDLLQPQQLKHPLLPQGSETIQRES